MDRQSSPTVLNQQTTLENLGPGEGPCERCGAMPSRTNEYMYVMSFLILTRHLRYEARLCRGCSTRTGLGELGKSAVLGWWGIPWGVMTFQALWINVRSLGRWSRIPFAVVALVALLGLSAPAALVLFLVRNQQAESQAKKSGDFADDAVVQQVDEAHRLSDAGKHDDALAAYLRAYDKAPGSSIINSSLAATYLALGRATEALPHAATAENLVGDRVRNVALHGLVLLQTGDRDGALARAAKLQNLALVESADGFWAVDLLYALEDWPALAKTAAAATTAFPEEAYFSGMHLLALLGSDDMADYTRLRDALPATHRDADMVALAATIAGVQTDPAKTFPDVLTGWAADRYGDTPMRQLVTAATRAEYLPEARRQVRAWLNAAETPADAWFAAHHWIPDDEIAAELDAYLARRPEPAPTLLRIGMLDPLEDSARRLELARRVRDVEHPLADTIDAVAMSEGQRTLTRAEWQRETREHLAAHPTHLRCRMALADSFGDDDPAGAAAELASLGPVPPELAPELAAAKAEAALAADDTASAARLLDDAERRHGRDPQFAPHANLLRLELAVHIGDRRAVASYFDDLASAEAEARAAALVMRWSDQLAAGERTTFDADIAAWIEKADTDALRASYSASTQSLLLLAGRTDAATVRLALGPSPSPTVPWVTLLRDAAKGDVDDNAIFAVASAEPPHAWGPRLARAVRARRYAAGG